ncbi:hypothetical protein LI142_21615 [Eubacterium limosum]|uniref:hypothetical protein n=1 Tax=Eubacterium limosum TaxID=1736 RepID=UPI001D07200E|nr:hypothetical protein [Eubacterium limosum]MCB6572100.1 hypothetical protein [Eubacterium limosum]
MKKNKRHKRYEPYGEYYDDRDIYERNGFRMPKPAENKAQKVLRRNKEKYFIQEDRRA